jgi:hypothetical protein
MAVLIGVVLFLVGAALVFVVQPSTVGVALMALGGVGIIATALTPSKAAPSRDWASRQSADPFVPLWDTPEVEEARRAAEPPGSLRRPSP